MSITPAMQHFIQAKHFAVIGKVLTDRSRWDNKVLRWYQSRELDVTPIIPTQVKSETKEAETLDIQHDPLQLPDLSDTSISVIIHPSIGLSILKSLFEHPSNSKPTPHGIWFQPGAESPEIIKFVKENQLESKVIFGGPCILVSGDELLKGLKGVGLKAKV